MPHTVQLQLFIAQKFAAYDGKALDFAEYTRRMART
jgi:hypothetical protein